MSTVARAVRATATLGTSPLGEHAIAALEAALGAASPRTWIATHVRRDRGRVWIDATDATPGPGGKLRVAAVGKAALAMAHALGDALGDALHEGVVVAKRGPACTAPPPGFALFCSGHPLPDDDSVRAGEALLAMAARTGDDDVLLAAISGGASALACVPDGISLAVMRDEIERALHRGTPIAALNAARGRRDRIKHGRLAEAATGRVLALVVVDVPGGDPRLVGSGPVDRPEIPHVTVADNDRAVEAAIAALRARGLAVERGPALLGEARECGATLAAWLRARATATRPWAAVCGGETTVTRRGPGTGGRTLELVLGAAEVLADTEHVAVVAFASDGDDGNSGAAGAVIDGYSFARAQAHGGVAAALAASDSDRLLRALGDRLVTGPTDTNVCDLVLLLAGPLASTRPG